MKKVVKITESNLVKLIGKIINEAALTKDSINPKGLKFGDGGKNNPKLINDVKELQQKLMNLGLLKTKSMKPTGFFGELTQAALNRVPGKETKKVADKSQSTLPKNVLVSDSLVKQNILFDPTRETKPFKCNKKMGCAEWVSNQLEDLGVPRQGNAWHSHNVNQSSIEKTSFFNLNPSIQNEMAQLFSLINSNPKEKTQEGLAKSIVKKLIPNQKSFKSILNVNDIVGLYYDDSDNFTKAFFEGATGMSDMGSGFKATDGPYFRRADNNQPWSVEDLGKKLKFVPGSSLKSGSGFGLNTHLGYVGAKVDGEPIIFHNVHGQILATPLSKMGKTKVLWVKSGPGEVIKPQESRPNYWNSFAMIY